MKTESEIRSHPNVLMACMRMPCGCRGTAHEAKCLTGLKMMKATAETLRWVLGENEDMQPMVDRMAGDVRDYIAAG